MQHKHSKQGAGRRPRGQPPGSNTVQIRFKANLETGEASISRATLRDLEEMPALLAADILKDVIYHAQAAYEAALDDMRAAWDAARATKQ